MLFFSAENLQLVQTVVFRWKSKSSAFQNTKNHWNRLIIRDDRSNLVLESTNCTFSHVFWYIGTYGSLPYVPMYQNTCENVQLVDSNTKFDLSSRIINRFQWFLVFWKAEDLLFHLKTTVCTNCKFFAEKNNFSYKNVQLIWKFASLVIWDLLGGRAKWPPKPYNCVRYVPSRDEDR